MLTFKRLLAAGAAVAAVVGLAACSNTIADVEQVKAPSITVLHGDRHHNLIKVATTIVLTHKPREFHSDLSVRKWNPEKGKWIEVSSKRWGLLDLPPVGVPKEFKDEFGCSTGRYYTRWFTFGFSHDGKYQEFKLYWPFAKGSNGSKPPSLHEAKEIAKCRK